MTTYLASLQTGLHESFRQDDRVFLLGEDIADPYGGAFKVSKGLSTEYPGRVLSTPICEAGFTGVASGIALRGLRPVVEIMFGDFLTLCTDQIVNHIAKFRGMYDNQVQVPIVIRTPMGGGRGYGATHSQCLEKMFLGVTDLCVVAPSHAHDPGQLLAHSILNNDGPVLFIEHKTLYPLPLLLSGGVSGINVRMVDEIAGYPTALLSNYDDGAPDVTLIAYGGISRWLVPLIQTLRDEEIRVLVAMPSSLKPLPMDTLVDAAGKSGKVIVIEEGTEGFNWGSEVAARLYERLFKKLLKPIVRIASEDRIIPVAKELEDQALVGPEKTERAIEEMLS